MVNLAEQFSSELQDPNFVSWLYNFLDFGNYIKDWRSENWTTLSSENKLLRFEEFLNQESLAISFNHLGEEGIEFNIYPIE